MPPFNRLGSFTNYLIVLAELRYKRSDLTHPLARRNVYLMSDKTMLYGAHLGSRGGSVISTGDRQQTATRRLTARIEVQGDQFTNVNDITRILRIVLLPRKVGRIMGQRIESRLMHAARISFLALETRIAPWQQYQATSSSTSC